MLYKVSTFVSMILLRILNRADKRSQITPVFSRLDAALIFVGQQGVDVRLSVGVLLPELADFAEMSAISVVSQRLVVDAG